MIEDLLSRILSYLKVKRYVSTYDLVKDLNIREHEAELILGLLLSEGMITKCEYRSECGTCPLSKTCVKRNTNNLRVFRLNNGRT